MAGYALSRFQFHWKRLRWRNNDIAFWIISQRFLPPAAMVIPFLLFWNSLSLIDTHIGLILAYTTFNLPFAVWIMRDFFNSEYFWPVVISVSIAFIVISIVFLWLNVRGKFMFIYNLSRGKDEIKVPWNKYRSPANQLLII